MEDAPAVAEACQDPEIPRWIPLVPMRYSLDDAQEFLRGCLDSGDERHPFAIADAANGTLVGAIDLRTNAMGVGHIGYWVAPEARGRGVATEALRRLCRYAIEELGLGRLELVTDPDNRASQRVAEKAGFRREGVLRSALRHQDGRRADSVMFSLLPDELR
jgi:RimJ/RimL family protein N-acetyltransferase